MLSINDGPLFLTFISPNFFLLPFLVGKGPEFTVEWIWRKLSLLLTWIKTSTEGSLTVVPPDQLVGSNAWFRRRNSSKTVIGIFTFIVNSSFLLVCFARSLPTLWLTDAVIFWFVHLSTPCFVVMFIVSPKTVGTTHAPVRSPSLPSLASGSLLFAQLGRAKELSAPGLLPASLELFTRRCVIRHWQMRGHSASGSSFLAGLVYPGKLHVQPQLLAPFPGMSLGPSQGKTLEKLNTGRCERPFVK